MRAGFFYFCGIFPLYYYGMNVCIPSNISLRFYIRKMTQINAARNIKQRLFLFFRKNPVPLPESKTKGCPCRAEIIPYERTTMTVIVNNKETDLTQGNTIADLAKQLELPEKGVAIALHNRMIPREKWADQTLQPNDSLVIIKAACGG